MKPGHCIQIQNMVRAGLAVRVGLKPNATMNTRYSGTSGPTSKAAGRSMLLHFGKT